MRIAVCAWCGKPYESDLMEGSDGMCLDCYKKEMLKLERKKMKKPKVKRTNVVLYADTEVAFLKYQVRKEADKHTTQSILIRRGIQNLPEYKAWQLEMAKKKLLEAQGGGGK